VEPAPLRPMVSTVDISSALIPTKDPPPRRFRTAARDGWVLFSKLISTHCHDEWLNRNTILHVNTLQTRNPGPYPSSPVPHSFPVRTTSSMLSTCSNTLVLPIPLEVHFAREPDPRQLEDWISVNEARILSQAANRQHHLRVSQRSIDQTSPHHITSCRHYLHDFERFVPPDINRPAHS
jgi:hypothetical protein